MLFLLTMYAIQEDKMKEYRREKRRERKKRGRGQKDAGEEEGEEIDPEMAAIMGFSGFGGTKKKAT